MVCFGGIVRVGIVVADHDYLDVPVCLPDKGIKRAPKHVRTLIGRHDDGDQRIHRLVLYHVCTTSARLENASLWQIEATRTQSQPFRG